MNKLKIIICLSSMILLMGCSASIGYLNDGIEKYDKTLASDVKVYSINKINTKYIEVGYVSAHMTDKVEGDVLKILLKERAAEMGADAIVSFKLWGTRVGGIAEGVAIKYLN